MIQLDTLDTELRTFVAAADKLETEYFVATILKVPILDAADTYFLTHLLSNYLLVPYLRGLSFLY